MPMAGDHLHFRHLCRLAARRCQNHYLQPQGKLLGSGLQMFPDWSGLVDFRLLAGKLMDAVNQARAWSKQ